MNYLFARQPFGCVWQVKVSRASEITIYTKYRRLKIYHKGKLLKEFPYPLSKK